MVSNGAYFVKERGLQYVQKKIDRQNISNYITFSYSAKKKERDRSLKNIIVIFSMVIRFFLTFISFNMKIKHTRTHFYTAGPILFLHDDAMNMNAKTYNIEFSALSFTYFKIPPTYTSTYMRSCGM